MIPTYNCAEYLRATLASVLAQDPGPEAMQFAVVDDGATRDDPGAVVAELGRGRVEFLPNPKNLGPTATFNACLAQARGTWVHLLHGDDLVLAGFYAECEAIAARWPDVAMIGGSIVTMDEHGTWLSLIGPEPAKAGHVFDDFLERASAQQMFQFAGVAVRRSAYERIGGFCTAFGHVADWDMWFRAGLLGPVACTSRPYGCFRIHGASDTNQQKRTGMDIQEEYLVMRANLARLGREDDAGVQAIRRRLSKRALRNARKLRARGLPDGRLAQARWAFRLDPTPKTLSAWTRARLAARLSARGG
jgi:GT2 family glycosyltransferase